MNGNNDYVMSFGLGGLFLNESVTIAELHRPGQPWGETAAIAQEGGAFPIRRASSARRFIREIIDRLQQLGEDELDLLKEGTRSEQEALLWLAVCRAYRFVAEFAVEVVADRYLSFQTELSYDDFDVFFERKAEWSAKLAGLSEATKKKVRAVLFRLMREASILSPDDRIMGSMLSPRLEELVRQHDPSEFRYFPGAVRGV